MMFGIQNIGLVIILLGCCRGQASSCDPAQVQHCLHEFNAVLITCQGDFNCECDVVHVNGASCYDSCPDDARTQFISTFSDGQCAQYNVTKPTSQASGTFTSAVNTTVSAASITKGWKQQIAEFASRHMKGATILVNDTTVPLTPSTQPKTADRESTSEVFSLRQYHESLQNYRKENMSRTGKESSGFNATTSSRETFGTDARNISRSNPLPSRTSAADGPKSHDESSAATHNRSAIAATVIIVAGAIALHLMY